MKKYLLTIAVMAMGATLLTGCSDDKSNDTYPSYIPDTRAVFVVNKGSDYSSIDGSLSYININHATKIPTCKDVYKDVTGKSLGSNPNDVIVYGEKVYVVGSDEDNISILNVKTCRLINEVRTTDLLGEEEGKTPRRIVAHDGRVYFTTYGGYVASIDTTDFTLHQAFKVGSLPEGLAFGDSETLYVANSDDFYGNGSISKIDLKTGHVTEIKNDKVKSPQDIVVAGDVLYVLDWGYYNDDWSLQLDAGVYMISDYDTKLVVPDATGMAAVGNMLYTYNDPTGGSGPTYSTYDILSNHPSTLNLSGDAIHRLVSPSAISVDPITDNIYIASRPLDPDTGEPSQTLPGFLNVYNNSGQFIESYITDVEPCRIAFYHYLEK